jgi:cytochrome oxidase Cu insertion factor (SCO1/SenC/PrrC family)
VGLELPARGPHGEFNPIELAHSNRFALVDGQGRLRGSYEVDGTEGLDRLERDVQSLLHE